MTGWNCQAGGRPLQGPSPILCEQPDGTALPQPDRPVTNVMPRNTLVINSRLEGDYPYYQGEQSIFRSPKIHKRAGAPSEKGPRPLLLPSPGACFAQSSSSSQSPTHQLHPGGSPFSVRRAAISL